MGWPTIEQAARGHPLRFVMWTGDPAINRYIGDFIKPRLKARYDLDLAVVPGQADIPNGCSSPF
jgi:putative spermidine/putrescine transport system substrate-binding protein